jgi:hypothetical protein
VDSELAYASFTVSGATALFVVYMGYRFGQRREYWIRRLNSYQDFYHQASQLVDLLDTGEVVPESVRWPAIGAARKAAYDAAFFDPDQADLTEEMKAITIDLVRLGGGSVPQQLAELRERIESIRVAAYQRDRRLAKLFFQARTRG